jgi:hypothetical protein
VLDHILGLNHTRCEFFVQVLKAKLPNHSKEKEHVLIAAAPDDGVEADDYYVNTRHGLFSLS